MLRALLFALLLSCGLSPLAPDTDARSGRASGIVVLMYHRFGEGIYPSTNTTLRQLELHIEELSHERYTVLPLPEIIARLRAGEELPTHTVAITIDDAYRSVYREAWPRLKAAGLPFTVFAATSPSDEDAGDFMSWDQLRELHADPLVTVGHHSLSHAHLPDLSQAELLDQLETASARFETELGHAPSLFAYPYGEFGRREITAVRAAGFNAAFGQHSGALQPPANDAGYFDLPRFTLNEQYGALDRFRQLVNTIPLQVSDLVPRETVLQKSETPLTYSFTVAEEVSSLEDLSCFVSNGIGHRLEIFGRRVELHFQNAFPVGRVRVNCTLYGGDSRWRWFGRLFTVQPD